MTITIFSARKIITMNPSQPQATHVAVRDGRILGAGALDELRGWGPHVLDTRFADKVLMPGFVEGHAHLMAGALRMWGVPVRYVSGYLLTHAPAGDEGAGRLMQGADASHAWVQVWCPGTPGVPPDGWLDLDPTNNLVPGTGHVRVATGRDFGDVTPLRGVIRGGGRHTLTVGVSTRQLPDANPGTPQGHELLQ